MFKYLWIVILVIPILIFIYYTIDAVGGCLKEAIHHAEKYASSKDIKWILSETCRYLDYYYTGLCAFWACIILFGIIFLFAESLLTYLSIIK